MKVDPKVAKKARCREGGGGEVGEYNEAAMLPTPQRQIKQKVNIFGLKKEAMFNLLGWAEICVTVQQK